MLTQQTWPRLNSILWHTSSRYTPLHLLSSSSHSLSLTIRTQFLKLIPPMHNLFLTCLYILTHNPITNLFMLNTIRNTKGRALTVKAHTLTTCNTIQTSWGSLLHLAHVLLSLLWVYEWCSLLMILRPLSLINSHSSILINFHCTFLYICRFNFL